MQVLSRKYFIYDWVVDHFHTVFDRIMCFGELLSVRTLCDVYYKRACILLAFKPGQISSGYTVAKISCCLVFFCLKEIYLVLAQAHNMIPLPKGNNCGARFFFT